MSKENVIRCDACGKTKLVSESTEEPWMMVQTAASVDEYTRVMEALQEGKNLKDLVDSGDFCSLVCLANWASARANLKALG